MTYHQDREQLLSGQLSCVDITSRFLKSALRNENNSFIEVYEKEALKRAEEIDAKIATKEAGRLAGMVFSVKDLIAIKDAHITGGSQILQGYTSTFHATAVKKMLDEDAILIGRANCDEFGMGSSNENSAYGPVSNHIDKSKVPGGSSGGSAVSVQEGACHLALGTDTGGSVRQPASFCGLYGFKPTYSRISRYGLLAYASSFDCVGIIANDHQDVQLVYEIIAGSDLNDATSSSQNVSQASAEPTRFGYLKQALDSDAIQKEIKDSFFEALDNLRADGKEVMEFDLPEIEYALPSYYILTTAEASSNLSRYDGFRYGKDHNIEGEPSLGEYYEELRSSGFGNEVKRRIFLGTFVLSARYYDAYYTQAQKARRVLRDKTQKLFDSCDVLLSPVTPSTAFSLGEHTKDPVEMYLSDLYTVHASVCGMPAMSIPLGNDNEGLPFGIQAMSNDFEEQKLFQLSKYLQTLKA